jgi:hypothetical protein
MRLYHLTNVLTGLIRCDLETLDLDLLNVPLGVVVATVRVNELSRTSAILLAVHTTLLNILGGRVEVLRTNGARVLEVTSLLLRSK